MSVWALLMLVAGALFSGGVAVFAWERVPAWRAMPLPQFRADFARAIGKADRVQPALLVATLVASVGFGFTTTGPSRTLALIGATGLLLTLVGSVAVLVPLQRRIIADSEQRLDVEAMRGRWFLGHLGRTVAGVVSFLLLAIATVV